MRLFLRVLMVMAMANIFFCCSRHIDDNIKKFAQKPIVIPYEKMDFFNPYLVQSDGQKYIRFVTYLDSTECLSCSFGQLSENERQIFANDTFSIVQIQYIVKLYNENKEIVRKKIIQSRLQGEIYFDTICVMEKNNPQINDNILFHSFVLNDKNEVIMVGNPFQNGNMEALFKKVIANERKKHKEIKKSV